MGIPPYSSSHSSFSGALKSINSSIQDVETIGDDNASLQDRVAAYQNLQNLRAQNSISDEVMGKIDDYLQTVVIQVPKPDVSKSGHQENSYKELQYKGRNATLKDLIDALSSGDTGEDFTFITKFNRFDRKVQDTPWLSRSQAENIDNKDGKYHTSGDGVRYKETFDGYENSIETLEAKGSASEWEQYASCKGGDSHAKNAMDNALN